MLRLKILNRGMLNLYILKKTLNARIEIHLKKILKSNIL